jgi:hypothetical protein
VQRSRHDEIPTLQVSTSYGFPLAFICYCFAFPFRICTSTNDFTTPSSLYTHMLVKHSLSLIHLRNSKPGASVYYPIFKPRESTAGRVTVIRKKKPIATLVPDETDSEEDESEENESEKEDDLQDDNRWNEPNKEELFDSEEENFDEVEEGDWDEQEEEEG